MKTVGTFCLSQLRMKNLTRLHSARESAPEEARERLLATLTAVPSRQTKRLSVFSGDAGSRITTRRNAIHLSHPSHAYISLFHTHRPTTTPVRRFSRPPHKAPGSTSDLFPQSLFLKLVLTLVAASLTITETGYVTCEIRTNPRKVGNKQLYFKAVRPFRITTTIKVSGSI